MRSRHTCHLHLNSGSFAASLVVMAFGFFTGCDNADTPGVDASIGPSMAMTMPQALTGGASFDPVLYDRTETYQQLDSALNAPLPESWSLQKFAPPSQNQGSQGSCVAWASVYAARSIINNQATGQDPSLQGAFSPSYVYNQIKIQSSACQRSIIGHALSTMQKGGVVPFELFEYNDQDCDRQPSDDLQPLAIQYRINGYQRLTTDAGTSRVDLRAMKQFIAQGSPVVVGMRVGGTFGSDMMGMPSWQPAESDMAEKDFFGHAMCAIGYDDDRFGEKGGGFLIMNSWGPQWGDKGSAWIPYAVMAHFTQEAYAVYPMGERADAKPEHFDIRFGFLNNATCKHIWLTRVDAEGGVFRSASPIEWHTSFKVEVMNNTPCYIYLFSQQVDGSSTVIFPASTKHSAFCGTTGTRLFPRNESFQADTVGTLDVMAILVTMDPVDPIELNEQLNYSRAVGLAARLRDVLGKELDTGVDYKAGQTIGARCSTEVAALAVVLELEKRAPAGGR